MSSIVISALALSAAPALAAEDHGDGSADVAAAMERDLGLTPEQVKEQGPLQDRAIKLDQELKRSLGDTFAGSQYDLKSGRLIVMVTDEGAAEKAKGAGAEPRLVKHSLSKLEAIQANLDAQSGAPKPGSREGGRQVKTPFTSWGVDPLSNSVHVVATKENAGAAKEALARYGDAASLEISDVQPEAAANWMDGGDGINGNSCSAGFNLRTFSYSQRFLLTAGHCVNAGSTLKGQGGVNFGPVLESWFPFYDDALARNTNTGYWIQGPWVDTNPSNGGIVITSGYTDLPWGFPMCKSGIKTKWTCGIITGKNESVTYPQGTVHGLTRHNACVEPGDSGGANVSVFFGYHAEGVTSGASMIEDSDGKKRCRAKFGLGNISWYFPIADSLAYYGPKYGITTW